MLSINNGYERLSKEYLALTEISRTLTSPLELAELLEAVMKKIVDVVKQADVGSIMMWDQSSELFRPPAAFGFDLEITKKMGARVGESITRKAKSIYKSVEVVDVQNTYQLGHHAELIMDDEKGEAVAFIAPDLQK